VRDEDIRNSTFVDVKDTVREYLASQAAQQHERVQRRWATTRQLFIGMARGIWTGVPLFALLILISATITLSLGVISPSLLRVVHGGLCPALLGNHDWLDPVPASHWAWIILAFGAAISVFVGYHAAEAATRSNVCSGAQRVVAGSFSGLGLALAALVPSWCCDSFSRIPQRFWLFALCPPCSLMTETVPDEIRIGSAVGWIALACAALFPMAGAFWQFRRNRGQNTRWSGKVIKGIWLHASLFLFLMLIASVTLLLVLTHGYLLRPALIVTWVSVVLGFALLVSLVVRGIRKGHLRPVAVSLLCAWTLAYSWGTRSRYYENLPDMAPLNALVEEINNTYQVPDQDNGAVVYKKALERLRVPPDWREFEEDGLWTRETHPSQTAMLDDNYHALSLALDAARKPATFFRIDSIGRTRYGHFLFLDESLSSQLRQLGALMVGRARLCAGEDDVSEAMENLDACFRLGTDLQKSVVVWRGMGLRSNVIRATRDILASRDLTYHDIEKVEQGLADWADAMLNKDCWWKWERKEIIPSVMALSPGSDVRRGPLKHMPHLFISKNRAVEIAEEFLTPGPVEPKSAWDRRFHRMTWRGDRISEHLKTIRSPLDVGSATFASRSYPWHWGWYDALTGEYARLQVLRLGAAAKRFVWRHGRPPSALEELAPKYIDSVPLDPFTNNPLKIVNTGTEFRAYSVGVNMKDNGGEGPTWERPANWGNWGDKDDIVFAFKVNRESETTSSRKFPGLSSFRWVWANMKGGEPDVHRIHVTNHDLLEKWKSIPPREAREELERLMADEEFDFYYKLFLAAVAASRGSEKGKELILQGRKNTDEKMVDNTLWALRIVVDEADSPPEWVIDEMIAALRDERLVWVRDPDLPGPSNSPYIIPTIAEVADGSMYLSHKLGDLKCEKAVPALIEVAKKDRRSGSAVWSLGVIGGKEARKFLFEELKKRSEAVSPEKGQILPRDLVGSMSNLKAREMVPILLKHLNDTYVIEALRHIGDRRAVGPLKRLVEAEGVFGSNKEAKFNKPDRKKDRLDEARVALAILENEDPIPALCRLVGDRSLGMFKRRAAVWELIDRADPRAIPPLIKAAETDPSGVVVNQSIYALGHFRHKDAVTGLIRCFDANFEGKSDWKRALDPKMFRENIAKALKKITGKDLGPDKKPWEEWWKKQGKKLSPAPSAKP